MLQDVICSVKYELQTSQLQETLCFYGMVALHFLR